MRPNWGYGSIGTQYRNDIRNFIADQQLTYDREIVVKAIKIANKLDIWYPLDAFRKTKCDVWSDSIKIFRDQYCNSMQEGHLWLDDYTGTNTKPDLENHFLRLDLEDLVCPHCGESIYTYVEEKIGDGTLMPFFESH